jgi:hypothetical protein
MKTISVESYFVACLDEGQYPPSPAIWNPIDEAALDGSIDREVVALGWPSYPPAVTQNRLATDTAVALSFFFTVALPPSIS